MSDYETSVPKHFKDEDPDDWEGSLVFRHWREDEEDDNSDEYTKWREEYLDDCGLYARHIIAEDLDREEYERRNEK